MRSVALDRPSPFTREGVRNIHRRRRSEAGQSLLEVALVTAFVLLPLALGVIEMGRYMYIGVLLGNAARAGAAYGEVEPGGGPSGNGIQTAACNDFLNNLGGPTVTCSGAQNTSPPNPVSASTLSTNQVYVQWYQSCGCDVAGQIATESNGSYCDAVPRVTVSACTGHWTAMVNVQATGKFSPLIGFPGIPNPIIISRTASIRANQ